MSTLSLQYLNLLTGGISTLFILLGWHVYQTYDHRHSQLYAYFLGMLGLSLVLWHQGLVVNIFLGITGNEPSTYSSLPDWALIVTVIGGSLTFASIALWPFFWLMFVISYTTHLRPLARRDLKLAAGALFIISTAAQMYSFAIVTGVISDSVYVSRLLLTLSNLILFAFPLLAVIGGAFQLYRASRQFAPLSKKLTATVVTPAVIVFLIQILFQIGLNDTFATRMYMELIGLPTSLTCVWLAITRYEVFDILPASRAVGRDTAVDAVGTGLVVVDTDNIITDYNPAAAELLSIEKDPQSNIGTPLSTVLPSSAASEIIVDSGQSIFEFPNNETVVEAETAPVTDDQGRDLGYTISLTDITEQRRRQQRIQVMNRVLRHNLRNEGTVITGYAEVLTDGGAEGDNYAAKIASQMNDLMETSEKARTIENVLSVESTTETDIHLATLVRSAIDEVHSEHDAEVVTMGIPDELYTQANDRILSSVLVELIQNAVEHNSEEYPSVNVTVQDDGTTIVVSDNGPGIPDTEVAAVQKGEETSLEHGSGLGLWLVRWGVDRLGGTLSFETDSANGTQVTIQLPDALVSASTNGGMD